MQFIIKLTLTFVFLFHFANLSMFCVHGAPESEISLGRPGSGGFPKPPPSTPFGPFEPSLNKLNEIDSSGAGASNGHAHVHHNKRRHPEKLQSHSCPPHAHTFVGNTSSLAHCPPRANNIIGKSLKDLGCKPRPVIVALTLPGPNYDLIPSVASVNRCGGYCSRSSTSCLPTRVSRKEVLVHQINKATLGRGVGHRPECATVTLEEHEECRCGCETQPEHCNAKQVYDYGSCSCVCINMDEKYECEKHKYGRHVRQGTGSGPLPLALGMAMAPSSLLVASKKWNPVTCSCGCVTESDGDDNNNCPNDLMWVPKMCRCIRVQSDGDGESELESGRIPDPVPIPDSEPKPEPEINDNGNGLDDSPIDDQGTNSIEDIEENRMPR